MIQDYLLINDDGNNIVFRVSSDGTVSYMVKGKLKQVKGPKTMLKAMSVFVKWVTKNCKLKK